MMDGGGDNNKGGDEMEIRKEEGLNLHTPLWPQNLSRHRLRRSLPSSRLISRETGLSVYACTSLPFQDLVGDMT